MGKFIWLGLGALLGIGIAVAALALTNDADIAWDEICPVLGPAQRLAEAGSGLIAELEGWLAKAESFLQSEVSSEVSEEARTGLGGILDRAGDIVGDVRDTAVDVVSGPLRALVDLAQELLASVREAVDAARDVMASIEDSDCN